MVKESLNKSLFQRSREILNRNANLENELTLLKVSELENSHSGSKDSRDLKNGLVQGFLKRGFFITFEGGEGSGKTTLIESLVAYLSDLNYSVVKTREPGGTKLSEEVRTLLLDRQNIAISHRAELALFLASRAEHVEEILEPALKEGKIILCDRYSDSSIVYQGFARNLGMEKVEDLCLFFTKDIIPDLTFFLDIPPKIGLRRVKKENRLDVEALSFHERVREGYLLLAKKYPKRFFTIDTEKLTADEVFKRAREKILCLMK